MKRQLDEFCVKSNKECWVHNGGGWSRLLLLLLLLLLFLSLWINELSFMADTESQIVQGDILGIRILSIYFNWKGPFLWYIENKYFTNLNTNMILLPI